MCKQYEYQQMQCGQCHAFHGPKQYGGLQTMCQWAKHRGGFGLCPRRTRSAEVRRLGWRDCPNCVQRERVHAMWTNDARAVV